ncbi:hypothetical protein BDFB_000301 [Asbolus verrucosus]|uniref:Uncharacterized protein n=1 Tax=Asbolus verrucosus TaxID=1661398 RepID=A0A482VZH7_ASBVE|nr:hypothetical protein BDFB_000301 [Asbolus verrucosus]
MNSAEEITKYKEHADSYYSPTLSKRLLGYGYDFPEKPQKKDKKWSIGSLFRRKKKEESDSSSEDESQKKGFLSRKKKKPEKKKKASKHVGTFDHVVLSRNSHLYSNGFNSYEEPGIFSDPSGGFNGYVVANENLRTMSPFKPISPNEKSPISVNDTFNKNKDNEKDEDIKRRSSNLEEALDELEAIYNSLRLGDEDLLERAEQREKDAAAKKLKEQKKGLYPNWGMSRGALSDSSFSYEPFDSVDSPRRKRFFRKSQTIDRRADDMAYRKLNKERAATINDPQSIVSKVSYLHTSPVFGRDMPNDYQVPNKNTKEPDITLDDVVYRNVKFANNSHKIMEPQPPFGIPIGPITLAANSDYLHAVPDNIHRPTFKPRKIPDLVKDDLAFRNLRKDQSKEPALPPLSPDDLKNNNACEAKLDLNSLKKKRAVRSLSANIGSLIHKDILGRGLETHKYNNNSENESKTLTDIADAMEIARQVLKEKENKISATKKAFLSDTDTNNGNSDNLTESRMNFLNSLKTPVPPSETLKVPHVSDNYLHTKPPRGLTPERKSPRSPKESTPIPVSPLEEKLMKQNESRDSSLDDLLTALATEARETNERISNELRYFAEENRRESPLPVDENLNKHELNKTLSDIDAVSEQAKLCEKLLEGVVDSTDLMASAKPPLEEVQQIDVEPVLMESVANIVLTRGDIKIEKKSPTQVQCESDHDYENLISDEELTLDEVNEKETKCTSPFEEHKAELIASFQELKKNVDLDIVGPRNVTESKENEIDNRHSKCLESVKDDKENNDTVTGEECVGVLNGNASYIKECAYVESSFNVSNQKTYVSNCDMIINSCTNQTCSSDVDSSSGFHSSSSLSNDPAASIASLDSYIGQAHLDSLESLKSPKLVLETSKLSKSDGNKQILENQSMICRDSCSNNPGSSSDMDHGRMNRERDRNSSEPGHILDDEKPTPAWYRDPATVAVACSYGFACAHQLASLDFVAILGILFAVLSFIAALIL